MKIKAIILLSCSLFATNLYAQDLLNEDYDWAKEPEKVEIPESWKEKNEVKVLDYHVREYNHDDAGEFVMFTIDHERIRLNTSEAVDDNNKLYLPVASESSIIKLKARVVKANGKINELDEDDIQEAEDEETGYKYKYYALEGIEIGDEIEYLYFLKKSPSYYGTRILVQGTDPKLNYHYEIVTPQHLLFNYKGYNGFPGFELDSSSEDYNILKVEIDTLEDLKSETGALYDANRMQVIFKLEENLASGSKNIVNYSNVSKAYHRIFMGEGITKKDLKTVKKIAKKLDLDESLDRYEFVVALEDAIKEQYNVFNVRSSDLSDLSFVYKNKRC